MKFILRTLLFVLPVVLSMKAAAEYWHLRSFFGHSVMSDFTAKTDGFGQADNATEIELDSGFNAGVGVGYQARSNWILELAWEYRSNDSMVEFADGDRYDDGNYASNIFFVNTMYIFDRNSSWQPYVGIGLGWIQEVDIDLERGGEELSYSGDGDIGFQAYAGLAYRLNNWLTLQGEVRHASFTDIGLNQEDGGAQTFNAMDYKPMTLQIGSVIRF